MLGRSIELYRKVRYLSFSPSSPRSSITETGVDLVVTSALHWHEAKDGFHEVMLRMLSECTAWVEALEPIEQAQQQYEIRLPGQFDL